MDKDIDFSTFTCKNFKELKDIKKKVGRPCDPTKHLPLEERRKIYQDMHKRGVCLSAEQTAIAIWDPETEAKPLSVVGILKIEQRALAKLRAALAERGLKSLDDIFEPLREASMPDDVCW